MRFSNTVLEKTRKFLAQCYVHDLRNSVDAIALLALLLARKRRNFFSSRRPKTKYLDFVLNLMFTLHVALND